MPSLLPASEYPTLVGQLRKVTYAPMLIWKNSKLSSDSLRYNMELEANELFFVVSMEGDEPFVLCRFGFFFASSFLTLFSEVVR